MRSQFDLFLTNIGPSVFSCLICDLFSSVKGQKIRAVLSSELELKTSLACDACFVRSNIRKRSALEVELLMNEYKLSEASINFQGKHFFKICLRN